MANPTEILLVDDEESILVTLSALLQTHGFNVTTAGSVPIALSLITQYHFDVLIADLNIGQVGDGFTVISAMRSTQPDALRIILTGYPAFESALEAIRQGIDEYLVKPTDIEVLVTKINARVGQRKPAARMERKRLTEIVREQMPLIWEQFHELVKQDSVLAGFPVSDETVKLLESALAIAEGQPLSAEIESIATHYGTDRRKEGFTSATLIRETRLLHKAISERTQDNLLRLDVSHLIPDIVQLHDSIDLLLEISAHGISEKARKS